MAEIDRQQASRQKQAPGKAAGAGAPKPAAPQTAAAFLQALLAGAGVEQIPLQTAEQIAGQIGNSALGRAGRRPQTAGHDAFAAGGLRHGTTGNRGLRPCREPGARLAGAAPAGYGGGQPPEPWGTGWGWQFFAPV